MHSVRIELAKLILVDTKITYYQATGDAGCAVLYRRGRFIKICSESYVLLCLRKFTTKKKGRKAGQAYKNERRASQPKMAKGGQAETERSTSPGFELTYLYFSMVLV